MNKNEINPLVKLGLELGPVILFFALYSRIKDKDFTILGQSYEGFIVATAIFIPLILVTTGLLWWLTGTLSKMQLFTAVLVVVFGGLGIWLNDDAFFKMKPTLLYVAFGSILAFGLFQGKSYLRTLMDEMMPMADEGWMILTRRFAAFFFVLASANEFVWRTMSTDAWVNFKTFGLTGAMFIFIMTQAKVFSEYSLEEDA